MHAAPADCGNPQLPVTLVLTILSQMCMTSSQPEVFHMTHDFVGATFEPPTGVARLCPTPVYSLLPSVSTITVSTHHNY